jgi:signal transduction histidine kinase
MAILDETPSTPRPATSRPDVALAGTAAVPPRQAGKQTHSLGTPRRSLTAELLPIITLPFLVLGAAAGLWPLWERQPLLAAVTTLVIAALITTGLVILPEPEQRATGLGMIFAGALLELSWCNEWGSGVLPLLSMVQGHGWLFVVGWALYRYPGGRLAAVPRRCFQVMTAWVILWPWALILTSRPSWQGYPADAWWPSLRPHPAAHTFTFWVINLSSLAVLLVYIALWVHRLRTAHPAQLRWTVPSAVAGILGAVCGSLVPLADAVHLPPQWFDMVDAVATIGVLAVPGALLVAVARRHLARAALAGLLVELSGAPSADSAVPALRRALGDPTLTVGVWSASRRAYLDADGARVEPPGGSGYRVSLVRSSIGEPLAVVAGDARQHTDAALFDAGTAAFGLSLENAWLLRTARQQLADLRTASARAGADPAADQLGADQLGAEQPGADRPAVDHSGAAERLPRQQPILSNDLPEPRATPPPELLSRRLVAVSAAQAERRRIEQDLHDGAQARFLALAPLIGAAQARTRDPVMSEALTEIKTELQGALLELRRLAHGSPGTGGLPPGGLQAAVASLAASCALPVGVELELPRQPLPAAVERAAYLVICEAMANAVKHSGGTRIAIDGRVQADRLVISVRDDGRGGAAAGSGRGLPGLLERAAAAGGRATILSPTGAGTTVSVEMPCG